MINGFNGKSGWMLSISWFLIQNFVFLLRVTDEPERVCRSPVTRWERIEFNLNVLHHSIPKWQSCLFNSGQNISSCENPHCRCWQGHNQFCFQTNQDSFFPWDLLRIFTNGEDLKVAEKWAQEQFSEHRLKIESVVCLCNLFPAIWDLCSQNRL